MTEYIAHPAAETVAQLGNTDVRYARGCVVVAAILDEGDLGVRRAEDMVIRGIDRPIQAIGREFGSHDDILAGKFAGPERNRNWSGSASCGLLLPAAQFLRTNR